MSAYATSPRHLRALPLQQPEARGDVGLIDALIAQIADQVVARIAQQTSVRRRAPTSGSTHATPPTTSESTVTRCASWQQSVRSRASRTGRDASCTSAARNSMRGAMAVVVLAISRQRRR